MARSRSRSTGVSAAENCGRAGINHAAVIFDLDDTLIDNHFKYLAADIKALNVVFRALGTQAPEPDTILRRADEIDRHSVETASPEEKFTLNRFPRAWVCVYEELCGVLGLAPRRDVREKVYRAAASAFTPPFPLVPGARRVLQILKKRGNPLYLLTMGDVALQREKIARTALTEFFTEIFIAVHDKKDFMARVASSHGKEATVMVGNSLRSDINPALRAGIHAVHIPRSTWSREKEPPVSCHFHRVEHIGLLPRFLDGLHRKN